jgi:integrase/recombinase XerD
MDFSPRKFKIKVQLPKTIKRNKEAIPKEDVIDILNQCSDIRLKTYVMLLAATGMCAVESLHIRVKDIDFENKPARISVMGENTKTKTDRTIFFTEEVTNQLDSWLKYKHRTRRVYYQNKDSEKESKKTAIEYRTPSIKKTDLVFAAYHILRNLQEFQALDSGQEGGSTNSTGK